MIYVRDYEREITLQLKQTTHERPFSLYLSRLVFFKSLQISKIPTNLDCPIEFFKRSLI